MSDETYDELALCLAEMRQRFGEDAFTNRRRLNGLLADRLPDAKREIRVVIDAIDDGVITDLVALPPGTLDMQIDRLVARLENARGTREDIARQVVRACAYALGLGELPSRCRRAFPAPAVTPQPAPRDDWVGVSQAVGVAPPAQPMAAPVTAPAPARRGGWGRRILFALLVMVATVTGLAILGVYVGNEDRQGAHDTGGSDGGNGGVVEYGGEFRDYGVSPQTGLQSNVGSPTPTSIPGAAVVGTAALIDELRGGGADRFRLVDVLTSSGHPSLPGAVHLPQAGTPGSVDDAVQRDVAQALARLTDGRKAFPLVFFCGGTQCWLSYNASLRALAAGHTNVFWYRGGLDAWTAAGQPLEPLRR